MAKADEILSGLTEARKHVKIEGHKVEIEPTDHAGSKEAYVVYLDGQNIGKISLDRTYKDTPIKGSRTVNRKEVDRWQWYPAGRRAPYMQYTNKLAAIKDMIDAHQIHNR